MSKRIVIALGGNALGSNLEEQMKAVKNTAVSIADLIEDQILKSMYSLHYLYVWQ